MSDHPLENSALNHLADTIERAGFGTPIRIALHVCAPLDVVTSQLALFMRPFTAGSRWGEYAIALSDEKGWQELRRILAQQN